MQIIHQQYLPITILKTSLSYEVGQSYDKILLIPLFIIWDEQLILKYDILYHDDTVI